MAGLTQSQAISGLEHGWTEIALSDLNAWMERRELSLRSEDIYSWGFVLTNEIVDNFRLIAYKNQGLDALRLARESWTEAKTIIYADGSGTTKDNPAGIGVVVLEPGKPPKLIAEHLPKGTNNVAELSAIWRGLKEIPDADRLIEVRSDSQYAMGACSGNAIHCNVELATAVREDVKVRNRGGVPRVTFVHVDGHDGEPGNELCDVLAGWARKYGNKLGIH
jgi:ribonuclease HI